MTPHLVELPAQPPAVFEVPVSNALVDYFRCPRDLGEFETSEQLSHEGGYFTFGGTICYGRLSGQRPSPTITGTVPEAWGKRTRRPGSSLLLPFDLSEVVTNLRQERYPQISAHHLEWITGTETARHLYYFLRPILPVAVRKHIQKIRLAGWDRIVFPQWPVDCTVETLMRQTVGLILRNRGIRSMPFIWFWPDGAPSCLMMTHDVEDTPGREFCHDLMDLDQAFGIRSAFQLVPEMHGETSARLGESIRTRGFEVNLHDLNHDGSLFRSRARFLQRAAQINRYARDLRCQGFRSGSMYREQRWYDAFEFSYDMSVPNVAHLEPQRGGCCTVMPYFIGDILELPLTTTQDYSLFHILGDYSIALWKEQINLIVKNHGFISFIAHPDYLIEERAQMVYHDLLSYLSELRAAGRTWNALPAEVNRWWRDRSAMRLVRDASSSSWRIEGPGSDRARVAYATLQGDRVIYEIEDSAERLAI